MSEPQSPLGGENLSPDQAKMGDVTPPAANGYGRLDRATIVDAGLRIAARPGVAEVRFRDLGTELDADPTAVYRHFRNKAELMAAMVDRLMSDVTAALPLDADWRTRLHTMASVSLDVFVGHPAIGVQLTASRPVGPGELRLVDLGLQTLEQAGLSGDALVEHYAAFSGMLIAYLAAACRERIAAELQDIPWIPTDGAPDPAEFPAVARHAEGLFAMDYRSTYFSGVRVLIDSIGQAAGAAADRSPAARRRSPDSTIGGVL